MKRLKKLFSELTRPACVSMLIQLPVVALLATRGLDRGFFGQFAARAQGNPAFLAIAFLSFALQALTLTGLAAVRRYWHIHPWDALKDLDGIAVAMFIAMYLKGPMALLKVYVPILSPLALVPFVWAGWPAYQLWRLFLPLAGSWGAAAIAAILTLALLPPLLYMGERVAGMVYKGRLKVKARVEVEYVEYFERSGDKAQAMRNLMHDLEFARKHNDSARADTLEKAIGYIERRYGNPLRPETWRAERPQGPPQQLKVAPESELKIKGAGNWIDYLDHFKRSVDKAQVMRDVESDAEVARRYGDERRLKMIEAAMEHIKKILEDLKSLRIFEGVVGLDDVKREIVWTFLLPLFFPEEAEGVAASGGILIYGPTGTGKTEVLRKLLDACRRLGIQVFEAKPSDVEAPLIGEGEMRVRSLFEKSRKRPTVIFIDEADGVLAKREPWEPSYAREMLKEFLQQMDGLQENEKVLVIACTNEPWKIEEAALRPGRLGTHFYAPPPNDGERIELFKLFLRDVKVEGEVDYGRLAELTKPSVRGCYCGADIRAICERARIMALQSGRKQVTMADLEAAAARTQPSISTTAVRMFERFAEKYMPINRKPSDYKWYTA